MLPSLPEIVALRNWVCDEVTAQAAGGRALALEARARPPSTRPVMAAPEWDPALLPTGDDTRGWSVTTATASLRRAPVPLALLGWTADDLIGQRLLVVIPHALREAHIAGFTHSVVSGGGDLLGQPLELPALRRDGTEIADHADADPAPCPVGRHVYLARIDPRD